MNDRVCLRCDVPTQLGHIPDNAHGATLLLAWTPGAPKPHWLHGIKRKPGLPVIAYRCPECGGLELVAPPLPARES